MPLIEIALFIQVGKIIGTFATIGVILLLGVVGAVLVKWQGLRVLRDIRRALDRGDIPGDGLIEGVLVLVSGALLITPGFFTDMIGLAILFRPGRSLIRKAIKRAFYKRVARYQFILHV